MKSDVSAVSLRQTRKVSYAEYALIVAVLLLATKFCTLPSVLARAAGAKATWVILILAAIEGCILYFATKTAKSGGLVALDLKKGLKVPLLILFALFFTLKLAAFSREIATYYALSLFENAPVLPIVLIELLTCALVARKGYVGIGRCCEIFVWLFAFVFLFAMIFTRTEGDLFNAAALFNPDTMGMGKGILHGFAWFGDGAIVALLDLRGEERYSCHAKGTPPAKNRSLAKRRIILAAILLSLAILLVFYAVFTSVYGEAAKMTDYAFIKLSAFKANTDELGSADWPVIILWAILSTLYVALLFLSCGECLGAIGGKGERSEDPAKKRSVLYCLVGGAAILFSAAFLDDTGDYATFMTRGMSVATMLSAAATVGVGVYALVKRKEAKGEAQE